MFTALEIISALILVALLIQYWQWRRTRAESRSKTSIITSLKEILEIAPDGYFIWLITKNTVLGEEKCSRRLAIILNLSRGINSSFDDVLQCFETCSIEILQKAVAELRQTGVGFSLALPLTHRDRTVLVTGVRASSQTGLPLADLLWVRDVSEGADRLNFLSRENQQLSNERDRLTAILDNMAQPVWLRDGDLALTYCNQAYVLAVGKNSRDEVISSGTELVESSSIRAAHALAARARAAGQVRSESFHLVMGGERRLIELTELPFQNPAGSGLITVGLALDQTKREEVQSLLNQHIAVHAEVLENLGTAIAIFAPDTRLFFFNAAFRILWRLDNDWLLGKPTYANVLDLLRDERRLPEVVDYKAFRAGELQRFTSTLEAREDLLHLPDERTLRRVVSAHPFGGLIFAYEDVTDALALERLHNTSLAVHRETLTHLHEGIAVFSPDGKLRLANPAYARIWNMREEELVGEPHFTVVITWYERFFNNNDYWSEVKDGLSALFSERCASHGRIERTDGMILDYALVPLPDGAALTTWVEKSPPFGKGR